MHLLHIHRTGFHILRSLVVSTQNYFVDILLLLGKFARYRVGTGVVGAVVFERLGSRIDQQQTTILQHAVTVEVVECLAVLRHDTWERNAQALSLGDTLHCAGNLTLYNALTAHLHCGGMHSISELECTLQSLDLLGRLHLSHLGYGKHQIDRLVVV